MRTWNRPPIIAVLFATSLMALAGCSQREAPMMAPAGTTAFSEAVSPYTLAFISRVYDSESNQTTFSYQLQNTGTPGSPVSGVLGMFTNIVLEVPSCAGDPGSFTPPNGAQYGVNVSGIFGVQWGVGYDTNPNYLYSITFPGDVPAGTVRAVVASGGQQYLQTVSGPCEGDFTVSGNVFTDADQDGFKGGSELGLSNVTVKLTDGESTQFAKTDSDGNYVFTAGTGTYTLSVDSLTADSDYNESLYKDWESTTSQSLGVTVGPNSTSNNFGWEPDVDKIVARLDSGDLPTTGKSYKWWRAEIFRAISGNHNTAYTPAQLLAFIHQIEGMALLDEYEFTPGNELQEVFDILNNHAFELDNVGVDDGSSVEIVDKKHDQGNHDKWSFLLRELLTFELNHVSGRGPDDTQLRVMLINWGEGVLKNSDPSPDSILIGGPSRAGTIDPLDGGSIIFRKANGATGGGGTGG